MACVSILIAFDWSYFLALISSEFYTSMANRDVFPHICLIQLLMHILAASQMERYMLSVLHGYSYPSRYGRQPQNFIQSLARLNT